MKRRLTANVDAKELRIMMSLGTFADVVPPAGRAFGEKHADSKERAVVWEEYVRRIGHSEEFALPP